MPRYYFRVRTVIEDHKSTYYPQKRWRWSPWWEDIGMGRGHSTFTEAYDELCHEVRRKRVVIDKQVYP